MRILLAGATGVVGRETLQRLRAAGHWVRTLSRDAGRAAAIQADDVVVADATRPLPAGITDGIDVVISCLGGNVSLSLRERRSYAKVDLVANRNLLAAALSAKAKRFVYLSVHVGPGYEKTRYIRAHEVFVAELRASGLPHAVVRPPAIYPALLPFLDMARKGAVYVLGDGKSLTNPVGAGDVADAVVRGLTTDGDLSVGGPEVMTRDEFAAAAFTALGQKPRLRHVPAGFALFGAVCLRLFHPRLSDLIQFAVRASTHECVAAQVGQERLATYFAAKSGRALLPSTAS